jgi:hypothetical protein
MIEIKMFPYTGEFAENKDLARAIRIKNIYPFIAKGETVVINFRKVNTATQSFIHALLNNIIQKKGIEVLDRIHFKNCSKNIKTIISIVIQYVQDGLNVD